MLDGSLQSWVPPPKRSALKLRAQRERACRSLVLLPRVIRSTNGILPYLQAPLSFKRQIRTNAAGARLFHGEILGLQRHVSFIHGDEFRERPDPVLMRPRINLVARLEPSHFGPDTDYDPGHVVA